MTGRLFLFLLMFCAICERHKHERFKIKFTLNEPSMTDMQELVVPKSMPSTFAIVSKVVLKLNLKLL